MTEGRGEEDIALTHEYLSNQFDFTDFDCVRCEMLPYRYCNIL